MNVRVGKRLLPSLLVVMRDLEVRQLRYAVEGAMARLTARANPQMIDLALKTVQLLAILAAGTWTFWTYLAHDRAKAKLEYESAILKNRQAEIEAQLKGVELDRASQSPLRFSYEIVPVDDSRDRAGLPTEVRIKIGVKNESKNVVVIPEGELGIYLGSFSEPPTSDYAVRVNGPLHVGGPVTWRREQLYKYLSPVRHGWKPPEGYELGGVAFGRFAGGEEYSIDQSYRLSVTPFTYFAFTSSMVVEEPSKEPYRYEYQDYLQVRPQLAMRPSVQSHRTSR